MIDIHCHILPGVDDGPSGLECAVQMLETAATDGISRIICTPHSSPNINGKLSQAFSKLEPLAASAGIKIACGMEYSYGHLHVEPAELRPLGGTSFLLIELGCPDLPPTIGELFFSLERNGFQIIIAHPERYLRDLDACEELARLGVFFQLNAGSILGEYGSRCRRMAEKMIEGGYCHYVASDAHGRNRTFRLRECRQCLAQNFGGKFAFQVLVENQERLLNNESPVTLIPHKINRSFFSFFRKNRPL